MPIDLEKAKGKSLAAHFKKSAAHHVKMAGHHEASMKAHEGAQAHHEEMGKADGANKEHHKAKAAFHKTMASHHEKMHKTHLAHADHHTAMATAHDDGDADDAKKAAFTTLGIEFEAVSATKPNPQPTDPAPTGDANVSKTTDPNASTAASGTAAAQPSTATAAAAAMTAEGDPLGVQKVFNEGVASAAVAAVKELLASPEFKKTIQEEVANTLLKRLGEQAQTTHVKTFAVPRAGTSVLEVAKSVATGATPLIDTAGVSADFADLVTMGGE